MIRYCLTTRKERSWSSHTHPLGASAFCLLAQVEATYFGTPRVEACQLEGSLNEVDLLPPMQTCPPPSRHTHDTFTLNTLGCSCYNAPHSLPHAPPHKHTHTQVEATYFGTPRVEAFQLEGSLNGVDLLPLMQTAPSHTPSPTPSAAAAAPGSVGGASSSSSSSGVGLFGGEAPPALVDGSRVRLKVTGGMRLSAVRDESVAARRAAGLTGDGEGYLFTGPVVLDGLRVNQLSLARRLAGDLALTEPRLLLKGKGPGRSRGDELLELDLALPPSPLALRPHPGPDGQLPLLLYRPPGFAVQQGVQPVVTQMVQQQNGVGGVVVGREGASQGQQQVEGAGGEGGEGGDMQLAAAAAAAAAEDLAAAVSAAEAAAGGVSVEAQRVSHVLLRRGDLHFSSTVSRAASKTAGSQHHVCVDFTNICIDQHVSQQSQSCSEYFSTLALWK